jgi:hypothetical protein
MWIRRLLFHKAVKIEYNYIVKHTILPFLLLMFFFSLFCATAGFADTSDLETVDLEDADTAEAEPDKGDFWFCPSAETAFYNYSGVSFGGGFAIGYGRGTSIGIKAAWFNNSDGVRVLEVNFIYRFYLANRRAYYGPFIQFIGGPAFFFGSESELSIPANVGAFSIGLSYGWRFLIKDRFFIEPSVRGGYPYLAGAGLSAGLRF